jgi:hypothetical protein
MYNASWPLDGWMMDGWMRDARRWMQGRAGQDSGTKWKRWGEHSLMTAAPANATTSSTEGKVREGTEMKGARAGRKRCDAVTPGVIDAVRAVPVLQRSVKGCNACCLQKSVSLVWSGWLVAVGKARSTDATQKDA